tara:strand:- start:1424 stop:1594 length:171 start_codon:yes stop_codon:yes gene_type:complete
MSESKKHTTQKTKQQISQFISSVSDKNYAAAHKYLQGVVEDKVITRITKATDKPLF